jgi:hypothetical protein
MTCHFDCLINPNRFGPRAQFIFFFAIDVNLVFGIAGIVVLLFCLGLVSGAEVALFSLSQKILMQSPK